MWFHPFNKKKNHFSSKLEPLRFCFCFSPKPEFAWQMDSPVTPALSAAIAAYLIHNSFQWSLSKQTLPSFVISSSPSSFDEPIRSRERHPDEDEILLFLLLLLCMCNLCHILNIWREPSVFCQAWQSFPVILPVDLSKFLAGREAVTGGGSDEESGIWKEWGGREGAASSLGLFIS